MAFGLGSAARCICHKYREYLQKTQVRRPLKPSDHRPYELIRASLELRADPWWPILLLVTCEDFDGNPIMSTAEILESTRKLCPVERLQLINALMESLDEPDPVIEAAWAAEAQDRLAAYQRVELSAAPVDELFAKLREQ